MSFHIKRMSANYRNLFAFIFVCFGAGSAIAQTKFEPLDDYLAARPKWNKEPNELSYVGMRCASLFWVIAGHFQANGNNKEHEETAEKLKKYGATNFTVAYSIGIAEGGASMSKEALMARSRNLTMIYADDVKSAKSVANNVFAGYIQRDFQICNQILESVQRAELALLEKNK
jgi:hypothetical protein